jgi:osmoprotectant transport system substrate-binding protein
MFTINKSKVAFTAAILTGIALAASGCASSDPLAPETDAPAAGGETIVIGSQAYYSNEIIAEIYAQALENAGFTVERKFQLGQRDIYIPSLEDGSVQLIPEYTGNLLQYFDAKSAATTPDAVLLALFKALPGDLSILTPAPAEV